MFPAWAAFSFVARNAESRKVIAALSSDNPHSLASHSTACMKRSLSTDIRNWMASPVAPQAKQWVQVGRVHIERSTGSVFGVLVAPRTVAGVDAIAIQRRSDGTRGRATRSNRSGMKPHRQHGQPGAAHVSPFCLVHSRSAVSWWHRFARTGAGPGDRVALAEETDVGHSWIPQGCRPRSGSGCRANTNGHR